MHEALVLICYRALAKAQADGDHAKAQALGTLTKEPQLLRWYTEEVLRNIRSELVSTPNVQHRARMCVQALHSLRSAMHT